MPHKNQLQPASPANQSAVYPYLLAGCLIILVLCWVLRASPISPLLPYVQTGVFVLVSALAVRQPFWGLVAAIAALPIALLIPRFYFGVSYLSVLGVATGIGYIVQNILVKKQKQEFRIIHLLGFLFVTLILLSNPQAAFTLTARTWAWVFVILWGVMWLATQLVRSVEDHRSLILAFVLTSVVSSLFAIYQVQYGTDPTSSVRGYGLSQGPNGASRFFLAGIILLFFLFANHPRASYRRIMYALSVVLMTGIASTISRHGILLTIGFGVLLAFLPVAPVATRARKFMLLLGVALLVLVPLQYFKILSAIPESLLFGTDSVGFRYMQWHVALDMWKDNLWFGIGTGQFTSMTPFYGETYLPFYGLRYGTHNMFLCVLAETGLVGFTLFMGTLIYAFIRKLRALRFSSSESHLIHFAWLTVFAMIVLSGFSGDWQTSHLLWLTLGLDPPMANES